MASDWYNDLSMFKVAGRSYAMPHTPEGMKTAATHVLRDGARRRRVIADALSRWLAELG